MDRRGIAADTYGRYDMRSYQDYGLFAPVPYGSLALQQRQTDAGLAELHQRQHQQQRIQHHHHHLPHQQSFLSHPHQTMAYMQSEEDLAEFQKLSNEYEPDTTGPLVGVRQPSDAITAEYSSADPVYQLKTAALPQKYSAYRTCRGDGRCGWRAIAFGYFESLLRIGNRNKFLQEEVRLKSLRNVCTAAGFGASIIEEFEEATLDLLKSTSNTIDTQHAESILVEQFNDEAVQNYIITHLRMLTAAWMKTRPDNYAPFVLPMTVDEYCLQSIIAHASEINDIGITALSEVLLKPADISLEIIYLDRSEGSEANVHHYGPMAPTVATTRLLYRPGHYDILYKAEDVIPTPPLPRQVNVPSYFTTRDEVSFLDHGAPDLMTRIPGMSIVDGWASSTPFDDFGFSNSVVPLQPQPQYEPSPITPATPVYSQISASDAFLSHPEPEYSVPGPSSKPNLGGRILTSSNGVFRPSHHMFELSFHNPFTACDTDQPKTTQFKNSHFNRAHFMNAEFQPEHFDPSEMYVTNNTRPGRRNKST